MYRGRGKKQSGARLLAKAMQDQDTFGKVAVVIQELGISVRSSVNLLN